MGYMSVRYGLHPGFLLTNIQKLLITFDRRVLELIGVHFWRLCFFEVSMANIRFLDFEGKKHYMSEGRRHLFC